MKSWPAIIIAMLIASGGCARAANTAATAADTIGQRVQPCTVCHGAQGHATNEGYYPRIAGKPAGYLFDQLLNFRDGRRHFPMMIYLTQLQDDTSLREMADYFAAQRLPYPTPQPPNVGNAALDRGRQLVMQGDASLQIPPCSACHDARLLGVQPAVPGLLGVSQDYLLGQLGAWRNGTRAALAPDCMADIARRLRPEDVTAVTAWLASQAVPVGTQAAAQFERPPPLECGSIAAAARAPMPQAAATQVQRGRELVTLGDCESCHTARGGAAFAGARAIPTAFGTFYSPNITPDDNTGIGRWSGQDFWHALHDGYSKDGSMLYPSFPYTNYTKITRDDAAAMFAYLRTVPPVSQPNHAHALAFPYNHRSLLAAWRWLFFRAGVYEPDSRRSAEWNRGAYLVQGLGHCSACHAARNSLGAIQSKSSPAGGLVLSWYAPALTRADEASLHTWNVMDIVTLLQSGAIGAASASSPHAETMGPMAEVVFSSLQHAPTADLRAMAVYLQTLSAAAGARSSGALRATDQTMYDGSATYANHCASCHGENGAGRVPVGPPLAGNRAVTMASAVNPIRIVLFGGYAPGTTGNPQPFGMPPYSQTLSDDQIADVLSYIRASWGNAAAPVSSNEIGPNRGNPLW